MAILIKTADYSKTNFQPKNQAFRLKVFRLLGKCDIRWGDCFRQEPDTVVPRNEVNLFVL